MVPGVLWQVTYYSTTSFRLIYAVVTTAIRTSFFEFDCHFTLQFDRATTFDNLRYDRSLSVPCAWDAALRPK